MKEFNIIFAGNRSMLNGITLASMSICKRDPNNKINIYILTMDFTEINKLYTPILTSDVKDIERVIRFYNKNASVILLDNVPTLEQSRDFFKKYGNSYTPYTLLRLFIDKIDGIPEKILYLDCDMMVNKPLDELFELDMTNYAIAAAHDFMGRFWINPHYFNAGMLLLNIPKIKETKLFENTIEMIKKHKYMFVDQTPLNKLTWKDKSCLYLPRKFNEQRGVHEDTIIKHFCRGIKYFPIFRVYNVKQWEFAKVNKFLKITAFNDIFEDYERMTEASQNILEIDHLVKTYGPVKAVNDISFKVKKGSLFAFLGINGAGKSTTINIICSILKKDSGKITVCGLDLDTSADLIKEQIGIVFQNSTLDGDLTVKENLEIRTCFYSLTKEQRKARLNEIVKILELEPILDRQVKKLSGGQKRKVDIARAMVHEPKILILDEPTTGLDPKARLSVWNLIDRIRIETGMTVFLTTHYLEEADQATYVTIMDKGSIITSGTPTELKNKYSNDYVLAYLDENKEFEEQLNEDGKKFIYLKDKKAYKIFIENALKAKEILENYSKFIVDFEVLKGNMDDVFLNVTGKNIVYDNE